MSTKGRPRSEAARQAVLTAAAELLAEAGYEALTIGAIATRAAVGRQTVYRWWSSKAAIVGEAVVAGTIALPVPAAPEAGTQRRLTLADWLEAFGRAIGDPSTESVVRALASAAAEGQDDAEELYSRFTAPAHAQISFIAAGQGLEPQDASALADAVLGALLFRVLTNAPVDAAYLATLARLGGSGAA